MFGIISNKMKPCTAFSLQMYRHDMRNLLIAGAVVVYLWADSIKWCVRLGGAYLFWVIALGVPSLLIAGAFFFFLLKPHRHPVYRQYLKYFRTIPEGTLAIDTAFYGVSMGFLRGRMFVSGGWTVEKTPFFSKLRPVKDRGETPPGGEPR